MSKVTKNPTFFVDIDGTLVVYRKFNELATAILTPISEVIDVTKLLTDMKSAGHNGMLLKLVKEEYTQWFRFASSDFKSPKLWPKLEIYYTLP